MQAAPQSDEELKEAPQESSLESPAYAPLASEEDGIPAGSYLLADGVLKVIVTVQETGVSAAAANEIQCARTAIGRSLV